MGRPVCHAKDWHHQILSFNEGGGQVRKRSQEDVAGSLLMEFFRELRGGKHRRVPARQYAGRVLGEMAHGITLPWEKLRSVDGFGDCTEADLLEFCRDELLDLRI